MEKKINILYDATIICKILKKNASRSGIFFVAYNVLQEFLKREDFNVYLYSENMEKIALVIRNYPEFKECRIFKFSPLDNILLFVIDKRILCRENGFSLLSCLLGLFISCVKHINQIFLNFVNIHGFDVYFSPMKAVPKFIARQNKIKKYTILHDIIPLTNDYRNNAEKHDWYHKLIKSINKKDIYFANSLNTKQDFIEHVPSINPDNIYVIPLSAGKSYFRIENTYYINQIKRKYGIPTDKKYIFSLCNLDPRKNLIFSIRNFLKFTEKNNLENFVFVLGGSHFVDFEEILNQSIENLGDKKDKILRIGYVDDEDVSALYSAAEMFVFPSLYEGFGIPVLEAMKCGLPVICSNTSSLPEVIGDCGIQINPYSDDEMIQAMGKMYFDRDFRAQCIEKGLERAKLFTWQKCVDVIENKIKEDLKYLDE